MKTIEETLLSKVSSLKKVQQCVADWKKEGKKIVFTNGVFDLLHIGHLSYLAEASALGDKLIIGLNSDTSVKRLKGPDRPVNDENSRAALLASMFFVDQVILFEEDTPLNLIRQLMPDVLVKGADYTVDQIAGAAEVQAGGGQVRTIRLVSGYSSSSIIERIRRQNT